MIAANTRVVDHHSGRAGTVERVCRRVGVALADVRFDDDKGRVVCRLVSDLRPVEQAVLFEVEGARA